MTKNRPTQGPGSLPPWFIETTHFREARDAVARSSLLLISGKRATGKTTLLAALAADWEASGGHAVFVPLKSIGGPYDLVRVLREGLGNILPPHEPAVIGSSAAHTSESIRALGKLHDRRVLLLLDGLDETSDPRAIMNAARILASESGARVAISSTDASLAEGRDSITYRLNLTPWTVQNVEMLLGQSGSPNPSSLAAHIHRLSEGNPLLIRMLSNYVSTEGIDDVSRIFESPTPSVRAVIKRILQRDVARAGSHGEFLLRTLARLAVRGPLGLPRTLLSWKETRALKESSLVTDEGNVFRFVHVLVIDAIVELVGLLPPRTTRLQDLSFGAEEAERDTLLNASYEDIPGTEDLRNGKKNIVIGDRGAGKSALYAASIHSSVQDSDTYPIALDDPAEFVLRLESNGEKLSTAEEFRAAWLLSLACSLAAKLSLKSIKHQRAAAQLRAALPDVVTDEGIGPRAFSFWNRLKRTKVKFHLGPVVLEQAKSTEKVARGGRPIDVAAFLAETAKTLREQGRRVVVAVDRIDEVHKYRRDLQERLIQGLFLAESSLSKTPEVSLLLFIRTDLFETCDIQEKNKLVSRTLRLQWSRSALARLLVRRICLNSQLKGISKLSGEESELCIDDALQALFPANIEGEPFEEWLWASLQNGRGEVAPRQLILLLTLLREAPGATDYVIDSLPIFREETLRRAMTRLSELSFGEIIDDFRVGKTLLRSCRAAKLSTFSLPDVERLFDVNEGGIALQVDLLERLGVFERLVVLDHGERVSKFRIPALYTRCWGTGLQ